MITKKLFNIKNGHDDYGISLDELPLLIDQIPYPCVIIDSKSKVVLAINYLLTEMTNYGSQELIGGEISSLFKQFPLDKVVEGKAYKGLIKIKRKPELTVVFKLHHISHQRNLAIIMITESDFGGKKQTNINKKIIHGLERINRILLSGEKQQFFLVVLEELCEIFYCSKSFLYLFNSQHSLLEKFRKDNLFFPNTLPKIELERIKNIDYWSPGKRVLTEIHRIGRREGYSSVITIPIGDETIGLLIVVSENDLIYRQFQEELKSFTNWVNHFINYLNMIDKKQQENAGLLKNNLIYSKLFEQSNDCLVLINHQQKIMRINELFLQIMNYSSYELIGQNILEIIQNDEVKNLLVKEEKNPVEIIYPLFLHNRDGNSIPMKMKVVESIWEKEKSNLIILSDISSEIEAKQTIEKIEDKAAIGEMIAYFAHEVRNPINDISTGLQLIRKRIGIEDPNLQVIDRMQSDCIRMNDLMESILSFSRQNISKFKPFNCYDLLERINRRFQNKYHKRKITSHIVCKPKDTMVIGDIRSIDQVFTNIINNATDAMMDDGGELSIQIDKKMGSSDFLEIKISDTGHGIPEEIKEKLFEPLISGKEKGTGLGLAITKRIIDAHGGNIGVESYTSGTIFTIALKITTKESK
jgi:PAS domain S-box-containing protein